MCFNGYKVSLNVFTNCKTKDIIYLLICLLKLGYVGETSHSLATRLTEHRSAIRTKKFSAPSVQHYVDLNHTPEDINWIILEKIQVRSGIDPEAIRK